MRLPFRSRAGLDDYPADDVSLGEWAPMDARVTRRTVIATFIIAGIDTVVRPFGALAQAASRTAFLTPRELLVVEKAADAMLPDDVLPARGVALRTETLLAAIDNDAVHEIRSGLLYLEWLLPVMLIFRPKRFSSLSRESRRKILTRLISSKGRLRDLARSMRVLTTFAYYTDENVRRSIGYVDFEDRPQRANHSAHAGGGHS